MPDPRAARLVRLQAESPLPLRLDPIALPGGYTLGDDEFVARTTSDWKMSSQPVVLTTQRLIFDSSRGASFIRLADVVAVRYRKSLVGHASVVVDIEGGRLDLPAHINGEQVRRDIAAMVEFAGRNI